MKTRNDATDHMCSGVASFRIRSDLENLLKVRCQMMAVGDVTNSRSGTALRVNILRLSANCDLTGR